MKKTNPRHILHLSTFLQGGAGRVLVDLARKQSLSHRTHVVVSKTEFPGYQNYQNYIDELLSSGVAVHRIDSLFKRDSALNESVAAYLVREFGSCDITAIHAHASIPAWIGKEYAVKTGRSIPVIQTMQGWGQSKTEQQERQDVAIMNSIDAIVAVSEASKKLLIEKGVSMTPIHVIPNAVAENKQNEIPPVDLQSMQNLKVNTDFTIGCFGSICERKNQPILLDVVEILKSRSFEMGVVLIGEDSIDLACSIKERKLDKNFLQLGLRPHARDYLGWVDLFCLPSHNEGLPLSILECFCDGTLVAGSCIPSICELVADGKTGFVFDQNDANSIAETISRIAQYEQKFTREIQSNARQIWQHKYSFERMAESYEKLYEEVCFSGS